MIGLFVLMITDYLFTKLGLTLGVITEGNPLMKGLFDLPISVGLPVRIIIVTALLALLALGMKREPKAYRMAIIGAWAINITITGMHFYWMANCL
jgi:hypothetical protein